MNNISSVSAVDDGNIELSGISDNDEDALAEARLPLLANSYTSSVPRSNLL